ncbi:hypothetical protein CLHUN_10800 [Ruminiclostridium hungatei]|uniref:Uncharacterized protein n=1 Tax=Ruminiclostridium hungatei TaxID=48256 RepID=A0A1V4SN08_RUMHU|nr:hypothetical protein [Ruminiclostridium hungatei]OPX45193.1 hypothetical protein CLHUN_10800 [Ruminiclostridium hungatei]
MSTLWSESCISFVNFKKTPEQFFIAEHQIDCGNARAYLKENGIETVQYVQDKLPNLTELAEEIISLGNSFIVFYVNKDNYLLSKTLTRHIKESEEDINIVWFGPLKEELNIDSLVDAKTDAYISFEYETGIINLFKTDRTQWDSIDEVLTGTFQTANVCQAKACSSLDFIPSPYQTKLIPVDKAGAAGVMIGRGPDREAFFSIERISSDLEFLNGRNKKGQEVPLKLTARDLSRHPEYDGLLQMLESKAYQFAYEADVSLGCLTVRMLEQLVKSGIRRLNLAVADAAALGKIEECSGKMKELAVSGKVEFRFLFECGGLDEEAMLNNLKFILTEGITGIENTTISTGDKSDSPKGLPKRSCISGKGLRDYIAHYYGKNFKRKVLFHENPLINGFDSYMTGIYGQSNLNGFTKHVSVEKEELDVDQYEKLKEYMSINSAVYVNTPAASEGAPIYSEGSSIIRQENPVFDKNVQAAKQANYCLEHLLTIEDKNRHYELKIDDYYRAEPLRLEVKKYSEAKMNSDAPLDFIRIENESDLESFLEEVDYFISTGRFNKSYLIPSFLVDSCRWLDNCSLTKLPRFRLADDNQILPCLDCNKSVGSIDDMQFDVIQQTYVLTEEEQLKRDCDSCTAADYCSKCAMLPEFLSSERYCEIRKQRPYISYYINIVNLLKFLKRSTGTFRDIRINDVMVSSKYVSYYTGHVDHIGETEYFHQFVNLFIINGTPVFYMPLTGKVYKLTEHLAVIMELMFKGLSVDEIKGHLRDMYKLGDDQIIKDFNAAVELFANTGSLKRAVI